MPTFYAIYDARTDRWFRGARFWKWTRHLRWAAQHDDPDVMEHLILPKLPFGCRVVKVEMTTIRLAGTTAELLELLGTQCNELKPE